MSRILITTGSFGQDDRSPLYSLRDAGYEPMLNPYRRKLTEDEVLKLILEIKPLGMIAGLEPITARVIEQAEGLKAISRLGIGIDNVDLIAAEKMGIAVLNTPDAPTQAAAELTIGLAMTCLRRIVEVNVVIRAGNWERPKGKLLGKQTLGIIGCGRIGSAVAKLAAPFGTKILGHDPYLDSHPTIDLKSILELLAEADIVSLHIPYKESTHHLVDKQFLSNMKKDALLICVSRGGIVDEDALQAALTSNHLSGAALDVFAHEPYKGPLAQLDNVVLTPHIGSHTMETRLEMEMQAARNLLSALDDQ